MSPQIEPFQPVQDEVFYIRQDNRTLPLSAEAQEQYILENW